MYKIPSLWAHAVTTEAETLILRENLPIVAFSMYQKSSVSN